MTAAIEWAGTDLDSMFEPYHSGTKAATTNIRYAGQDLANRYQAVAAGNGTAYGSTKIYANGKDIGTLFIKKGTFSQSLSVSISPASSNVYQSGTLPARQLSSATFTASASGGTGSYTYTWTITNSDNDGTNYVISAPSSASSYFSATLTAPANTQVTTSFSAFVSVKDSAGATGNASAPVSLSYLYTGSCPTAFTYLPNGQTASTCRIGNYLRITDPYAAVEGNTTNGEVLIAEAREAECVHVELANGGWFECSTTAPIPTKDAGHVLASDLLGHAIPTATKAQLSNTTVPFNWTEVISVAAIGLMPVMLIFVNDRDFWMSGDGKVFVLHHNAKAIN